MFKKAMHIVDLTKTETCGYKTYVMSIVSRFPPKNFRFGYTKVPINICFLGLIFLDLRSTTITF